MAIDLLSDDWRMLPLPYLVSLHASAVTCSQHVSGVPQDLWDNIVFAGKKQTQDLYSDRVSSITDFMVKLTQTSMKYIIVRILNNVCIFISSLQQYEMIPLFLPYFLSNYYICLELSR